MVFFLQSVDGLPEEVTSLMKLATDVPPVAHVASTTVLLIVGALMLIVAVWRLVRGANRLSSLHLATGHVATPAKDMQMANR